MTQTLHRNSTSFTREGEILRDDLGARFTRSLTGIDAPFSPAACVEALGGHSALLDRVARLHD